MGPWAVSLGALIMGLRAVGPGALAMGPWAVSIGALIMGLRTVSPGALAMGSWVEGPGVLLRAVGALVVVIETVSGQPLYLLVQNRLYDQQNH